MHYGTRQRAVGLLEESRVLGALGQGEELLREFSRRPQLPPDQVKVPQSSQHREELWRLPHLLAQLARSGVGVSHFWSRIPLSHRQRLTKGDLQVQLMLEALGAAGQGREHLESLGEMADRLQIRRALEGTFTCPLPVGNGAGALTRLGVVLGD